MESNEDWLTPDEAAAMLRRSKLTIANWRSRQIGPRHYKRGRWVEYRRVDVEEYLSQERRRAEKDGEEKKAS